MPINKLTLKEWKELGLPVHRSYIQLQQKPLSNQKLQKFLGASLNQREVKNG
jgi:hypothetical protein